MKSSEIIKSWDGCRTVFWNAHHWLILHRIIAAGERGTNTKELGMCGGPPSAAMLEVWRKAGLIERREIMRDKLPRLVRYVATKKARRLLRVEKEDESASEPKPKNEHE